MAFSMSVILELGGRMVLLTLALLPCGAPSHTHPELLRACWAEVSQDTVPLNLCWEDHLENTLGLWSSCKESPEHPTTLEMPQTSGEATLVHNAPSFKRSPGPLPAEGHPNMDSLTKGITSSFQSKTSHLTRNKELTPDLFQSLQPQPAGKQRKLLPALQSHTTHRAPQLPA